MILKPPFLTLPNPGLWLTKGLVGYWLMNEGGGNVVQDLSGNGNTQVFQATSPTWSVGPDGHALSFVPNQYSISASNPSLNFVGKGLTVICKFKRKSAKGNMWKYRTSTGYIRGNWGATTVGGYIYDGTHIPYLSVNCTLTQDVWYTVVTVYDFSSPTTATLNVYRDGIYVGTDTVNVNNNTFTAGQFFLGMDDSSFWTGEIEYIYLYNRALSASEIAELYRDPFGMLKRYPIELWSSSMGGGGGHGPTILDYERKTRGVNRGVIRGAG